MILYHGTSVDSARRIIKGGFRYGVKHNWKGAQQSKEGFTYLSLAYAPFYTMTVSSKSEMRAIVKASVPKASLYPDEDFLYHLLGLPLEQIDITKYQYLAGSSLNYLGNAAARPEDITVLGSREFNAKDLILVCDPSIVPANYQIMGGYYRNLTEWIYQGKNPLEYRDPTMMYDPHKYDYLKEEAQHAG